MSDEDELRAAWTMAVGAEPRRPRRPRRRDRSPPSSRTAATTACATSRGSCATSTSSPPRCPVSDLGAVTGGRVLPRRGLRPDGPPTTRSRAPGWPSGCSASSVGPPPAATRSAPLVRATAEHDADGDADGAVLLDADLAVLGSEPAAYQAYVTGVRAEYAHVDAAAWRTGRAAVLRDLLARRPLYATAPARARWEARAGANMAAELATPTRRTIASGRVSGWRRWRLRSRRTAAARRAARTAGTGCRWRR